MPTLSTIASQLFRWFNFIALNIDDVFTTLILAGDLPLVILCWFWMMVRLHRHNLYCGSERDSNMVYRSLVGAEIGVCVGVGLGGV